MLFKVVKNMSQVRILSGVSLNQVLTKKVIMNKQPIRQGDVLLFPVSTLPSGCIEVPNEGNRIVLAHGEVTGHAHAIYDHISAEDALNLAKEAISKAKLWKAPTGDRFLEVKETVSLRHEEHSFHSLLPGIYKLPQQMEYTPAELRRVAD